MNLFDTLKKNEDEEILEDKKLFDAENKNIENKSENNEDAYEKYRKLRNEIEKHNKAYYDEDAPLISDAEYDKLIRELKDIEEGNPELKYMYNRENTSGDAVTPTEKIGGTVSEKFSKVTHKVPMLSLSNTYNISEIEDFEQWARKIIGLDKNLEYIIELKIDVVRISQIY